MAGQPKRGTGRNRPRDPVSGVLKPWRNCQFYRAGHTVHHIQAIRSIPEAHRNGRLVAVDENRITIDFGDEAADYRNHDTERLVDMVGIGGNVRICERFVILRGMGDYCFSIAGADEPWTPCDTTPITSMSPEALAERLKTHGGFLVPGHLVTGDSGGAE
jgi:hypothetical protein